MSLDLTETCRNSSIVGGVPNSRQIKQKLRDKETKSRKKSKVKYHVKKASPRSSREFDDTETVKEKEQVIVGSSALFNEYVYRENQINSPFKESKISSKQIRKLVRKHNT